MVGDTRIELATSRPPGVRATTALIPEKNNMVDLWRKRGDSNARESCDPTRFRVVRLQPLGHASAAYYITILGASSRVPLIH